MPLTWSAASAAWDGLMGYDGSVRKGTAIKSVQSLFSALVGFTKCNPGWVAQMALRSEEIDGVLPDNVMPVVYYKKDDKEAKFRGIDKADKYPRVMALADGVNGPKSPESDAW